MKKSITNQVKNNKKLSCLLRIFVIIQPFIDMLPLYENNILGLTIPTIIRLIFIFLISLITIKIINKQELRFISIYLILMIIYTIIHHIIVSNSMVIPNNFTYSLKEELFYIIRMMLPLLVILFTKKSNINQDKLLDTITIVSAIIGTIIFIGNTLCLSYTSYGKGITIINWINWFLVDTKKYEFTKLTSKGWFYLANQISGITVMLLPFTIFNTLKNTNIHNMYASIILIISMIMLGTRIASYGWILVIIIIFITVSIYSNEDKFKKISYYKTIFIITIVGIIFMIKSPIRNREYGYKLGNLANLQVRPRLNKNKLNKVYQYIKENYKIFKIQEDFIFKQYNYQFDPEFWYNIFDKSVKSGVIENREMQRLISARIIENNNNHIKYQLFGYSFSRMRSGGTYMEHDIVVQTFTMGYIGVSLLLGPYIFILIIVCYEVIKNLKRKIALFNTTFLISIGVTICSAILSSHILDELFATTYIGFILGYFLNRIEKEKE